MPRFLRKHGIGFSGHWPGPASGTAVGNGWRVNWIGINGSGLVRPLSLGKAVFFAAIHTGSAFVTGSAFREVSVVVKYTTLTVKPSPAIVPEHNFLGFNNLRFVHFFYPFLRFHLLFRFRHEHARTECPLNECNKHTACKSKTLSQRIQNVTVSGHGWPESLW
jgi:hypothetical protein